MALSGALVSGAVVAGAGVVVAQDVSHSSKRHAVRQTPSPMMTATGTGVRNVPTDATRVNSELRPMINLRAMEEFLKQDTGRRSQQSWRRCARASGPTEKGNLNWVSWEAFTVPRATDTLENGTNRFARGRQATNADSAPPAASAWRPAHLPQPIACIDPLLFFPRRRKCCQRSAAKARPFARQNFQRSGCSPQAGGRGRLKILTRGRRESEEKR